MELVFEKMLGVRYVCFEKEAIVDFELQFRNRY